MSRIRQLIREIHRRSLWQVLGVYGVTSWVVYEVVLGLYDGIGLPEWVPPTAVVLLLIGLPIVLATALVQEGGPDLPMDLRPGDRVPDAGPGSATPTAESTSAAPPIVAGPRRATLFTWPRAITGGVLAFAALGLAASGFMGMRALGVGPAATLVSAGMLEKRGRVVLADFRSRAGDPALAFAVTEALRADLAQSDALEVASRNEVSGLLLRMEREPDAPLTAEIAREIAIRGGMKAVISGEVAMVGDAYLLTAEIAAAQEGNVLASFRETAGDSTELIPAIDRLSKTIREKVGESLRSVRQSPYLMAITTPSLPALRKLVQAYDAENRGESERALALLAEAIELDPAFAAAHRKRGAILGNFGRTAEAVLALEQALEHPDRLTDYERYHTEALYANTIGDRPRALSAYRTLLELDPGDAAALNNIALVHYENGDWARAEESLERGVEVNLKETASGTPVFGPTFAGLAEARWNLGDRAGADSALDLLAAQEPAHVVLLFMRGNLAAAAFDHSAARRWFEGLIADHSGRPYVQVLNLRALAAVASTQGRVREGLRHLARAAELQERERQTWEDGPLGDGIRAAFLHALVLGDRATARQTLAEFRTRFPLEEVAAEDAPYATLAVAYATAGQLDSARAVIDLLRTRPAEWYHRRYPFALAAAEGAVALEEGRYAEAAAAFEVAHTRVGECPGCFLVPLGLALQGDGRPDSAVVVFTRYLETDWASRLLPAPYPARSDGDAIFLGLVLERLAELHEARGELDRAADYYRRFADLWNGADPELQPRVHAARRALERLGREAG